MPDGEEPSAVAAASRATVYWACALAAPMRAHALHHAEVTSSRRARGEDGAGPPLVIAALNARGDVRTRDDGNSDDGNSDDGNSDDGNSDDGNSDDGNSDDGNSDDGNSDDGDSDGGDGDDGDSDGGDGDDGDGGDGDDGDGDGAAAGAGAARNGTAAGAAAAAIARAAYGAHLDAAACGAPPSGDEAGTWLHSGGVWGADSGRMPRCDGAPLHGAHGADGMNGVDSAASRRSFDALLAAADAAYAEAELPRAEMCARAALAARGGSSAERARLIERLAMLEDVFARAAHGRVHHAVRETHRPKAGTLVGWLAHGAQPDVMAVEADGLVAPAGGDVRLYRGALSVELCASLIELFEASSSEHYEGNVFVGKTLQVVKASKCTTELDISNSPSAVWAGVDEILLRALTAALARYVRTNPGYSAMANPLFDEGFRLKRYPPPQESSGFTGRHDWHADRTAVYNCRELAFIFYLNTVEEGQGGETLFYTPYRLAVRPESGAVLIFPAGPSHLHAGADMLGHASKYTITTFVRSCAFDSPVDHGGHGHAPAHGARVVAAMREDFAPSAANWMPPPANGGAGAPWRTGSLGRLDAELFPPD